MISRLRRRLPHVWLALAIVTGAWAAWLAVFGGVDARLLGIEITSNDPWRPFVFATVAAFLYVRLTGGFDAMWTRTRPWLARVDNRVLAGICALAVLVAGVRLASTTVIGADSYGYVSQADLWLAGDLRVEQPWMAELPWPDARWSATPLGYRPADTERGIDIVPLYSPGLPLMMAAAKAGFGQEGLFWTVPLTGAVLVLATFGIGARLGSSRAGAVAAWFVATSPIVLFMLMPAMSDVSAAAAWAAAVCGALRPGLASVFGAGLAGSIAILIRPNLVMLAGPVAAIVLLAVPTWRRRALAAAVFAAGAVPGIAFIAWHFNALYGSPFTSGYGDLDTAFDWSHLWPNVTRYLTWLVDSQTWLGVVGLAAIVVPTRRVWPFVRDRRLLLPMGAIVAFVAAQYLAYYVYDTWWFLRFFLPFWPYLCLGLAAVLLLGVRHRRGFVALASLWLIVALGFYNIRTASKLGAFGIWEADRTHPEMSRLVGETIPENSMVLSLIYSGALRYYGARTTLRYDILSPDWLDKAVEWLSSRGVRTYALLEEWEIREFETRFKGQRAGDLSTSAVLIYQGFNKVYLFDLATAPSAAPRLVTRSDPTRFRSTPPQPPATFRFPK